MKFFLTALMGLFGLRLAYAQNDTTKSKFRLNLSAYMEFYYSYDFSNPVNHLKPGFIYSYNRSNQPNLDLAYGKLNFETGIFRLNAAIMAGTYAVTNLADEPGVLKYIYEANVGFKLSKKKNVWLDAGVFPSHIGFESAAGKDSWTLTRSIVADNSPYYESGLRVTYLSNDEKLTAVGLVLNGWQHIAPVKGNTLPSFGWQVSYLAFEKITFNSSSFAGPIGPDSSRKMRYYHDLYAIYQPVSQLGITFGFDIGAQQKSKGNSAYYLWYAPLVILRYSPASRLSIAARYEFYSDSRGVIFNTGTGDGFQLHGVSANIDYSIIKNVVLRAEGKIYKASDDIFTMDGNPSDKNYSITTSIICAF